MILSALFLERRAILRSAGSCGSRKLEHNQFVTDAAPFKGRVKIKAAAGSNENGGVGFERFLCDYMVPREWKVL
jgi:hypothetical protein